MSVSSRPSRFLLLTDAFPPHAGGSREYYYNIYREMVASGQCEITVLTKKIAGWKEFDSAVSSQRFRIRRLFKPLKSWKYSELPKAIGPLFQALWSTIWHRPDVIHAGDLYPAGLIAIILRKLFGIPYVIYCHGEEVTQTDRYRYQPRVRDFIYKTADAVIANSDFAKSQLSRIGVPEQRVYKITPGVDCDRFQPGPSNPELVARYGLHGKTVVLTVARLVPRKGHRAAISAFSRIAEQLPNAHYLIVGTGPEESAIRAQIKELNLENRVTLAGFVPGSQLPELYNLCDIMLLANRQERDGDVEGFGIVFLEANAAGKPVIGGRSGGAIEAIEHGATGFLVNPDDPEDIARALHSMLASPDLRTQLGAGGRVRACTEYRWDTRAQFLDEICQGLASLRSPQMHMSPANSHPVDPVVGDSPRGSAGPSTTHLFSKTNKGADI